MKASAARDRLEAELAAWAAAGRRPRLFWRDDDAIADTPALDRLIGLAEAHGAPLLVAAIPALAEASLGRVMRHQRLVTGAVHGWAHANHAPLGEKPCELGRHRPLGTVLAELATGRARLGELCAGNLSALLVPPWNRIHAGVLAHVGEAGFAGVSAHGWLEAPSPVAMVNAHVDIIHWSGGRVGRDTGWVLAELARNLGQARRRGHRAVGVLSHHLAHDEAAWRALDAIFAALGPGRADWVAADDLIAEPPELVAAGDQA